MNSRLLTFVLVLSDWLLSTLAWGFFYYLRKMHTLKQAMGWQCMEALNMIKILNI